MTVIGNNGALQETIKLRQFLPQFPWKSAPGVSALFVSDKTALEKQQYKNQKQKKEGKSNEKN